MLPDWFGQRWTGEIRRLVLKRIEESISEPLSRAFWGFCVSDPQRVFFFFFLCRRKAGGDLDTTDVFQEYISLEKWLSSMVNQWLMCSREATLGYAQIRQVSTLSWTDARVHSNRAFNLDTKRSCWLQEQCQERAWVAGAGCTESTWEPSSRVMPCPRTSCHMCICFFIIIVIIFGIERQYIWWWLCFLHMHVWLKGLLHKQWFF